MERIRFLPIMIFITTDDCEWSGGRTTTNLDKNALDKFEYDGNTNLVYSVWIKHYVAVNRSNFAIENISNMGSEQIRDDVRKKLSSCGRWPILIWFAYMEESL